MASAPDPTGDTKRRLLDQLKRVDGATVAELAAALGITPTGVRQHLDALQSNGLVDAEEPVATGGRGRPPARWTLTPLATELFPDRHSDLTVELIAAIRAAVGEEGLDAVISARTARQREAYRAVVDGTDLAERVEQLATQRASEGYLAEAVRHDDGTIELVEHHCPICDAAASCAGLCRDELALFREVLGDDAHVERSSHLLSGDARCTYRITPVGLPSRAR